MALRIAPRSISFLVLSLVLRPVVLIATLHDAFTVSIRDGYLQKTDGSKGEFIGLTTSALQSKVVDAMFDSVNASSWSNVSLINRTTVRSLELHGEYQGDTQLMLPSLFRLRLNGSITVKPGLSTKDHHAALVVLRSVTYTAVVGGTYDASGSGGFGAVSVLSCNRCSVLGIRGLSDSNIISVNEGSSNEVSRNNVGPGAGRCIWALATRQALVHSNQSHGCASHSLDFDAYTSHSVAYNNTCSDNGKEGIFVEETASQNVIVGNTIIRSNNSGIGVYSNAVGPVKENVFIGNTILDNHGTGITVGGYGHNPTKKSEDNVFVDNFISGNTIGVNIHHGLTKGDFWTGNANEDNWIGDPQSSSSVTVFDPLTNNKEALPEAGAGASINSGATTWPNPLASTNSRGSTGPHPASDKLLILV